MKELLLISLFFCHWLGDYTHLSTKWMLDAKRIGYPIIPIMAHAGIHALLMGVVLSFYLPLYEPKIYNLISLQFFSHFLIDVLKGKVNVWFPSVSNSANKQHWYVFGFDQLLHMVVIVIMFYFVAHG